MIVSHQTLERMVWESDTIHDVGGLIYDRCSLSNKLHSKVCYGSFLGSVRSLESFHIGLWFTFSFLNEHHPLPNHHCQSDTWNRWRDYYFDNLRMALIISQTKIPKHLYGSSCSSVRISCFSLSYVILNRIIWSALTVWILNVFGQQDICICCSFYWLLPFYP